MRRFRSLFEPLESRSLFAVAFPVTVPTSLPEVGSNAVMMSVSVPTVPTTFPAVGGDAGFVGTSPPVGTTTPAVGGDAGIVGTSPPVGTTTPTVGGDAGIVGSSSPFATGAPVTFGTITSTRVTIGTFIMTSGPGSLTGM